MEHSPVYAFDSLSTQYLSVKPKPFALPHIQPHNIYPRFLVFRCLSSSVFFRFHSSLISRTCFDICSRAFVDLSRLRSRGLQSQEFLFYLPPTHMFLSTITMLMIRIHSFSYNVPRSNGLSRSHDGDGRSKIGSRTGGQVATVIGRLKVRQSWSFSPYEIHFPKQKVMSRSCCAKVRDQRDGVIASPLQEDVKGGGQVLCLFRQNRLKGGELSFLSYIYGLRQRLQRVK